jgi:hypothetical protein
LLPADNFVLLRSVPSDQEVVELEAAVQTVSLSGPHAHSRRHVLQLECPDELAGNNNKMMVLSNDGKLAAQSSQMTQVFYDNI